MLLGFGQTSCNWLRNVRHSVRRDNHRSFESFNCDDQKAALRTAIGLVDDSTSKKEVAAQGDGDLLRIGQIDVANSKLHQAALQHMVSTSTDGTRQLNAAEGPILSH